MFFSNVINIILSFLRHLSAQAITTVGLFKVV